jgi:hypothetical protein
MDKRNYLTLLSDLEGEFMFFSKTSARVLTAKARVDLDKNDQLLWSGFAYLMHNLYTGYEAYFLRISKFFENGLPADEWHKILVDRMTWQIEELRPAFLKEEDRIHFQELRSFRHLVRHIYDRELDPERVARVFPFAEYTISAFPERHKAFCDTLRRMAKQA